MLTCRGMVAMRPNHQEYIPRMQSFIRIFIDITFSPFTLCLGNVYVDGVLAPLLFLIRSWDIFYMLGNQRHGLDALGDGLGRSLLGLGPEVREMSMGSSCLKVNPAVH